MFSKIKEWVKVNILNIKPIFKIKIEESWFSKKYYAIKFSNNNGWSWRYLQEEGLDLSSHCDELECRVGYYSLDEVKYLSQTLTSYELCDEYNMKLHEKIATINSERRKKYLEDIDDGVEYMKEFNKD
jgi:hypothetical protein